MEQSLRVHRRTEHWDIIFFNKSEKLSKWTVGIVYNNSEGERAMISKEDAAHEQYPTPREQRAMDEELRMRKPDLDVDQMLQEINERRRARC